VCSQSRFPCDSGVRGLLTVPASSSVCYDVSVVARTQPGPAKATIHCAMARGTAVLTF
jgi:hypothetical protein